MPGGGPRLAIRLQVRPKLRQIAEPRGTEDRVPLRAVGRIGVRTGRGDTDLRIRLLVGLRHQVHVVEVVVLPVEAEALLRPRALEDLEHLDEAITAFGVGHAVRLVHPRKAAASDAEDQPAVADLVHRRRLLGQLERMAERQHLHGGTDLHPLGPRGDRGCDRQRRGQHRTLRRRMQFRQPHHVEAVAFGRVHLLEGVGERLLLGLSRHPLKLVEHAEFHCRRSPLSTGIPSIRAPCRTGWASPCPRARRADCRRTYPGCAHCRCSGRRQRYAG